MWRSRMSYQELTTRKGCARTSFYTSRFRRSFMRAFWIMWIGRALRMNAVREKAGHASSSKSRSATTRRPRKRSMRDSRRYSMRTRYTALTITLRKKCSKTSSCSGSTTIFLRRMGKDLMKKIYVRELEKVGVEDRGPFYEPVGRASATLVRTNLQMSALVAMDRPKDLSAPAVRAAGRRSLETTCRPRKPTGRAKFVPRPIRRLPFNKRRGAPFARPKPISVHRISLDHPRWEGVQFIMEAGKRMAKRKKEIEIEVVFAIRPRAFAARHPLPRPNRFSARSA